MPVQQVTTLSIIEKNHVYVIPPNRQLSMNGSYLKVSELNHPAGKPIAVDLFFRTLADAQKERAVGIVLSGTGADGSVGLARIRKQGGVTFAQRPDDAEYDGMPSAAIEAGAVDFVLPASDIPRKLTDLSHSARWLQVPPAEDEEASIVQIGTGGSADALEEIIALLLQHTGHDFHRYKQATFLRRIERRLQISRVPDLPSYRARLAADPDEITVLFHDLLIGVTSFFRDREAFEALGREVVAPLLRQKPFDGQIRVWATACSTGEEAYSLAMLLCEEANRQPKHAGIQVFATDIDERAILNARAGTYPASVVTDITSARLQHFFIKEDRGYRIKKTVRDKVLFATHDLLKDPPFSRLDLISCRNFLIYLTREGQTQLLQRFHSVLNPGGFLFLGSCESADIVSSLFTPIDKQYRIYCARTVSRSSRDIPALLISPATGPPVTHMTKPSNQPKFSFENMHHNVAAQYGPPSLIVNNDSKIVHMSEGVGRFLRYISGEPSTNLIALVLPELRLELRTALFQAIHTRKSVEARRVQLQRDARPYWVNMVARPFHDDDAPGDFVLVLFDEVEDTMTVDAAAPRGTKDDVIVKRLEEELLRTKEQLQETIERSETSTEELKASNEELQAINEELRSATEELETSKEELQSVNEELVTVNHELKMRVEEVSKINDDLNNLIASTDVATIFVDQNLHIKRYTPRATEVFSIIPTDLGRSLLDITHRLNYPGLAEDAATTFKSLRLVEREVSASGGRFYIVRILPYRTTEDSIQGGVLTFIDITSRHYAEKRIEAGERRIRLFAESTKDYAIMTSDNEGRITSWNKGAEQIFGYTEEEALGQRLDLIYTPEDIASGVPDAERKKAREQGRVDDERWYIRKDGTRVFCGGVVMALRNAGVDGYAKIASDLTGRARAASPARATAVQ